MEIATIAANKYPTIYENACRAITECANLDECKGWVDRGLAMEAYAKQANDDTLLKMAMRIKLRAARKCGQMLNDIPSGKPGPKLDTDTDTELSKTEVAEQNNISKRQSDTYKRIANVPDFEEQINSENVPTMTALAEQGKKDLLKKMDEMKDYPTYWVGGLNHLIDECKKNDPTGFKFHNKEAKIKKSVTLLIKYLEKIL